MFTFFLIIFQHFMIPKQMGFLLHSGVGLQGCKFIFIIVCPKLFMRHIQAILIFKKKFTHSCGRSAIQMDKKKILGSLFTHETPVVQKIGFRCACTFQMHFYWVKKLQKVVHHNKVQNIGRFCIDADLILKRFVFCTM